LQIVFITCVKQEQLFLLFGCGVTKSQNLIVRVASKPHFGYVIFLLKN